MRNCLLAANFTSGERPKALVNSALIAALFNFKIYDGII
jgi:hypothetical protein